MVDRAAAELESAIRQYHQSGDLTRAITTALRGYGPEILGYLAALTRNQADADEVFSMFAEDVFRGMSSFGWRSTFRVWAYSIARHALFRFQKMQHRTVRRSVPISKVLEADGPFYEVRPQSAFWLNSSFMNRFSELREKLARDEQELLILRYGRDLSWDDIVAVFYGPESVSDAERVRRINRLKSRCKRLRDRLRQMAIEAGLVPVEADR